MTLTCKQMEDHIVEIARYDDPPSFHKPEVQEHCSKCMSCAEKIVAAASMRVCFLMVWRSPSCIFIRDFMLRGFSAILNDGPNLTTRSERVAIRKHGNSCPYCCANVTMLNSLPAAAFGPKATAILKARAEELLIQDEAIDDPEAQC